MHIPAGFMPISGSYYQLLIQQWQRFGGLCAPKGRQRAGGVPSLSSSTCKLGSPSAGSGAGMLHHNSVKPGQWAVKINAPSALPNYMLS